MSSNHADGHMFAAVILNMSPWASQVDYSNHSHQFWMIQIPKVKKNSLWENLCFQWSTWTSRVINTSGCDSKILEPKIELPILNMNNCESLFQTLILSRSQI